MQVHFDRGRADKVLAFFRQLKHTKGRWSGVNFTLLPWQEQALSDIFGTVREDGFRCYNTAYLEVPKKMGKSETAAGVGLYCLTADNEWAAEVYGCAADRQQASIVFDVAVAMVEKSPALTKHIKPVLSQKRLVYLPTQSFYQVLSAESHSKHGFNAHAVIFDELHAQKNRKFFDVMTEGSGDARDQPLIFIITTAGDDPDRKSIGWEMHKLAVDTLTGVREDPTFYGVIYGVDRDNRRIWTGREFRTVDAELENDEEWRKVWTDEAVWEEINPSIGHTVAWRTVKNHFMRAEGSLVRERNFRWLRLNSWEKLKTSGWMGLDFWDLCRADIDVDRLKGRPCYGGLDLSSKIDLTSFVLAFPPDDINKKWIVLPWFWVPEDCVAERTRTDNVPYETWVKTGMMEVTPGNVIDYNFIEKRITELAGTYKILQIGFDPWNAMQTAVNLMGRGLTMVEVRQGFRSLSPPMKEVEQLVRGKKLIHSGHPVLRWNVGNVEVRSDENENVRPVKDKSTEKIDGLVALLIAMARAMIDRPTDPGKFANSEFLDKLWG